MPQLLTRFQHLLQPEQRLMPELAEPGHEIICGTIGMGKSYWVLYKIVKSFVYDRPCCYIDPKGDTYRNLLAFFASCKQGRELWECYRHRIILMNPLAPSNWLVSFNAIEPMRAFAGANPDRVALLANSVVSHIRRQSGFEIGEANRMQNIMSAAIGLLAEGGRGQLTLAELPLLFVQTYATVGERRTLQPRNPLVEVLLPEAAHHGTLSFWQHQWPNWPAQARREGVQSTEGRIFQYLFLAQEPRDHQHSPPETPAPARWRVRRSLRDALHADSVRGGRSNSWMQSSAGCPQPGYITGCLAPAVCLTSR